MKCIQIEKHGSDIEDLIKLSTAPNPIPKNGEVLVKVQACALAPGDIRVMKGKVCNFILCHTTV